MTGRKVWFVGDIQVWHAPEQKVLIPKPENPAKKLLSSYLSLIADRDALIDEIRARYEKAISCTSRISPIYTGASAAYDRTSENATEMMDAELRLAQVIRKLNIATNRIFDIWEAMESEKQKQLLLYRYIRGMSWEDIMEKMGYERTQVYVIHGRALLSFNRLMQTGG